MYSLKSLFRTKLRRSALPLDLAYPQWDGNSMAKTTAEPTVGEEERELVREKMYQGVSRVHQKRKKSSVLRLAGSRSIVSVDAPSQSPALLPHRRCICKGAMLPAGFDLAPCEHDWVHPSRLLTFVSGYKNCCTTTLSPKPAPLPLSRTVSPPQGCTR